MKSPSLNPGSTLSSQYSGSLLGSEWIAAKLRLEVLSSDTWYLNR
jgi:hypothetical protein